MRRPWRRLFAAAALCALAPLVACGPESTTPASDAPAASPAAGEAAEPEPPPPDLPPGPALDAPKPDSSFSGPSQAPAGLPDDVPLYQPATPLGSMASPSRGTIVNLQTADAGAAVFDWYRAQLAQSGWTIDRENAAGAQHLLSATKDRRKVTVLIRGLVQGSTTILLTVAPES